ncbi:MAG: hypothetical protein WKF45_08285 [Ilumatobacteraceae bacterium]
MSITEYQRHQLFTWFEEHMGKERATTMMNLVPPVGWGDVATTRDLELHRAETKHDLLELRTAVGELEPSVDSSASCPLDHWTACQKAVS